MTDEFFKQSAKNKAYLNSVNELYDTLSDQVKEFFPRDKYKGLKDIESYVAQPIPVQEKQEPDCYPAAFEGEDGNYIVVPRINSIGYIDSFEDEIREALENGGDLEDIKKRYIINETTNQVARMLKYIVGDILFSDNPRLQCDLYNFAGNLNLREGISKTEMAKRYGMTKQNFSKDIKNIKKKLNLPDDDRQSKSSISKEIYKHSNKRNYSID